MINRGRGEIEDPIYSEIGKNTQESLVESQKNKNVLQKE